ncbi:TGBp1 family protein [Rhizobium bangladeshense]|uniref:TGBp1 family protein n=1 Tax=Rhizobium bangladeshense TaxID=1138189 RepID=UPI002180CABC|nr:TGBp1 family protein [Rhizobium bangladeshense]
MVEYEYVKLDRRLAEISSLHASELSSAMAMANLESRVEGRSWVELSHLDCGIVLGSAGAGKTREILELAKQLRASGTPAFVLRIEALLRLPAEQSFSHSDEAAASTYAKWKREGGPAVALLDALDEARLPDARNTSALADALTKLSASVGKAGKDLKVIITSRASEWQGDSDLQAIKAVIRGLRPPAAKDRPIEVKTFRLLPLRADDVKAIAASRNIDVAEFVGAIDKAKAANLVSQPLDAQLLIDLWQEAIDNGHEPTSIFRSRLRVYDDIVGFRLRTESGQERRSNLDPLLGRRACEKLAAVSLLTDIQDFTVDSATSHAINALSALSTDTERWSVVEVRQLLSYGIFQPSVSGLVRFAHNELRDYLAACHFRDAITRDAGSLNVVRPLLAQGLGHIEIPQSTEHVLGWLAALDRIARKRVTELRPALLIETGDPTALTAEEKSQAIRSHVAAYKDRNYRGEWFSNQDVRDFVTPDLAPAIREQLAIAASPEVRELLIEMIRFGRMSTLVPELGAIACDQAEKLRVRAEACFALADLKDTAFAQAVMDAALGADAPEHEDTQSAPSWNLFVASALSYTVPAGVPILNGIALTDRLRREARNYSSATSHYLEEFVARLTVPEIGNWLQIFLRFAKGYRDSNRDMMPARVPRFRALGQAICHCINTLLVENITGIHRALLLEALEFAFSIARNPDYSLRETGFPALARTLRALPDLKHDLIAMRMALFSQNENNEYWIAHQAIDPLKLDRSGDSQEIFTAEDVRRLVDLMTDRPTGRERELAFTCARQLADQIRTQSERDEARLILRRYARRYGGRDLKRAYGRLAPLWRFTSRFRHSHPYTIRRWVRSQIETISSGFWTVYNTFVFLRRWRRLSSGLEKGMLIWAVRKSPNDLGTSVIEGTSARHGKWIARIFAAGFKRYWRDNDISYADRDTYQALVGLTGLALETPEALAQLSDQLVERAFRYGFANLNSFPDWVFPLALLKRQLFANVATSILEEDMGSGGDKESASDGFSRIAYSSSDIRALIAPPLFQLLLTSGPPRNRRDLEIAVNLVARSSAISPTVLTPFLQQNFTSAVSSFRMSDAWIWLDALFSVEPASAWASWTTAFGHQWSPSSKALFVRYMGRESPSYSRAEEQDAERNNLATDAGILRILVKAAYLVWPPANDPVHEDVYSPEIADKATSRRSYYLNVLTSLGSEEALACLDTLAADPDLGMHRDLFVYQRDKMVRTSVRRDLLPASEAITFLNSFSKAPTSIEEFRALVKRHLVALLEKLHHFDDDEGFVFRSGRGKEDDIRNWLSGRMREIGAQYYEVIREQEVAVENRPDLRVHSRNPQLGLISVEIKMADEPHWTGDILIDKIQTQLADQYMFENGSHTGFYLLANGANPRVKVIHPKTGAVLRKAFAKRVAGKTVNFLGLIEQANSKALAVTAALSGNKVLEVISVDLSER